MLINFQCHSAKVASNTNGQNFASKNLEYNELKASTNFACQSIKSHYVEIVHFKKIRRYIESENF